MHTVARARGGEGPRTFGQHLESLWPQVGLHRAGRPCPQVQAYTYFGTCFCGNTYGDHGVRASSTSCSMRCSGNSAEMCGANAHNSLYYVSWWLSEEGLKKASRGEMSKSVASTSDGCRWSVGVHRRHTTLFRRPEGARRPASIHAPSAGQLMRRAGHTRRTTSPTRRSRPSSRQSYDSLYVELSVPSEPRDA